MDELTRTDDPYAKVICHTYTEPMGRGELPKGTIVKILLDGQIHGTLGKVEAYQLVYGVLWHGIIPVGFHDIWYIHPDWFKTVVPAR